MKQILRWHPFETAEDVAQHAVQQILLQAQKAINKSGQFKLVLAGGTTPERIYELLSQQQLEWSKWLLFIGDERCLEANDSQRNSLMIKQTWLDKVSFPMQNFFPMAAELGAQNGAQLYAKIIQVHFPFDLTLLGIGEDGHTASLFPGHKHDESELTHAVQHSPKPPLERVSLSKKALSQSEQLFILVTGSGKKGAVEKWQNDQAKKESQHKKLPVAQISAINGVDVFIDQKALPEGFDLS
jgi:6-phosphogluconolactonase